MRLEAMAEAWTDWACFPFLQTKRNTSSSASESIIKHMPENKFTVQGADPVFTETLWANYLVLKTSREQL